MIVNDCITFMAELSRGRDSRQRRRDTWRKTAILTALVPLLGIGCGASDPFSLRAELPWLALVPLLIGVQHGLVAALATAAALCAGAWAHAGWIDQPLPATAGSHAAAATMLAVIAGLGRDGMRQRHTHALRELQALTTQVEQYQRAYHVLERSHDELVQRLACEPTNLQLALDEARRELAQLLDWPTLGGVLLRFLGRHADVQAAVLHARSERTGQLEPAPAARLGGVASELMRGTEMAGVVRNPLVERALQSGRLVSWVDIAATDSAVRVAVPLLTSSGEVLGVVAIQELPFSCFEQERLQDLFTLALALTDLIAAQLRAARRQPLAQVRPRSLQATPAPAAAERPESAPRSWGPVA